MHLTKKHKLYFTDDKGTIRNLNKASRELYSYIMLQFLKKGATQEWETLNARTEPGKRVYLPMELPFGYQHIYDKLASKIKDRLYITYQGTYTPLVSLTVGVLEQRCPDCKTKIKEPIANGKTKCRRCHQYVEVKNYVVKRAIPKELVS